MVARTARAEPRDSTDIRPSSIQSEIRDGVVHRVQRLTVKNGRLLELSRSIAQPRFAAE